MAATTATLDRVMELYDQGHYLQAYAAGAGLGPVGKWQGTNGRILAGRLASRLGAPRLGNLLHYLAWRQDTDHPDARYVFGRAKLQRGRLLATWNFLRSQDNAPHGNPAAQANWYLLHVEVLAAFRDFQWADRWLRKAEDLIPDDPWLWCIKSRLLAAEDLHEEALVAVQHALTLQPWYVPAVQAVAHGMMRFNRDQEALALLSEAAGVLESGDVVMQLASLCGELGEHQQARDYYAKAASYYPLMEPGLAQTLNARRSDTAYFCGDYVEAAQYAEQAQTPFHAVFLPKLKKAEPGKRVLLPMKFVQQHHVTCAPATLAAVSAYWSMPAEHLEIAESICYDGTRAHSERRWAESNGFRVLEYCPDWVTATTLLEKRIPWLLATSGPGMGHVQAVVGFDTLRRTLIIRDPSRRELSELFAETLFDEFQASGPRGMVMVPVERAELLDSIVLPESKLYDSLYHLQSALARYDRYQAQAVMEELQASAPEHRLTLEAQSELCRYDADPVGLLSCTEQLLERFPGDLNLLTCQLGCLSELGRLSDRLAVLKEFGAGRGQHPALLLCYARELRDDARYADHITYLMRRMLRYNSQDGETYQMLAKIFWGQQRREEALTYYRFAACMADRSETAACAYFQAARHLKKTDQAMQFLQDRFRRFGKQSSMPACTLCWAYGELAQEADGLAVMDTAERLRPDDPELLIGAANMVAEHGDYQRARDLLLRAKPISSKTRWLREAAHLAMLENAPDAALTRWNEVLEYEPMAVDAHQMVAQLLADKLGPEAAITHLREALYRYPRSYRLRLLLLEWTTLEGPEEIEQLAREILEFQPLATRVRCTLAQALLFQGRVAEGIGEAELARQLHPSQPEVHTLCGQFYRTIGDLEAAKQAFQAAIQISADASAAIGGLLETGQTYDERREAFLFIHEALVRQTIFGDGLLVVRQQARGTIEPLVVLDVLREAHAERPDLWHTWSALVRQLIEMEHHREAVTVALNAVDRFPLRSHAWVDLALAQCSVENHQERTKALHRALQLNPGQTEAACELAKDLGQAEEFQEAKGILVEAVARVPNDARARGELAAIVWQLGDEKEAIEQLTRALRNGLSDEQPWKLLVDWAHKLENPDIALDLARELNPSAGLEFAKQLTSDQPHEIRWRLAEARFQHQLGQSDSALETLRQARILDPQNLAIDDLIAETLADLGRFDEALAACHANVSGANLTTLLRARAAEIMWLKGDAQQAVDHMQRAVDEEPALIPGWYRLTDWLYPQPTSDLYLQAATRLTQLTPNDSVGWAHRGCACLARQDHSQAKQAFLKAVEIAPRHQYAVHSLFNLYLEDQDLALASDLLEKISPNLRYVDMLAAQVRLATHLGKKKTAQDKLRELCRFDMADLDMLWEVAQAMTTAGWQQDMLELLAEEIEHERAAPLAAQLWIKLTADQGNWDACQHKLRAWKCQRELWHPACCQYLTSLAHVNKRELFQRFITEHRAELREILPCWSAIGATMAEANWYQEAIKWFVGWESRSHLQPQMLYPLTDSLVELDRNQDAERVSRFALELPEDQFTSIHALWVVLEDALSGNLAAAAEMFQRVDPAAVAEAPYFEALFALVEALVSDPQPADATSAASFNKRTAHRLSSVERHFPIIKKSRSLQRQYLRAMAHLSRQSRQPLRASWYFLRLWLH